MMILPKRLHSIIHYERERRNKTISYRVRKVGNARVWYIADEPLWCGGQVKFPFSRPPREEGEVRNGLSPIPNMELK
jgi:hypothetical protein